MNQKFYFLNFDETLKILKSKKSGLSNAEAKERLKKYGKNKLKEAKKVSLLGKFIDQFKNIMLIILIISAIISAFVSISTNEPITDTIIILFVVFLNAILGVVQENKAEKAIEALKSMSPPFIKVRRNSKIININVEELVIGDIVLLEAGDFVPADMRIIENHSIRVEEAALTGESNPVNKISEKLIGKDIALADRTNMLYSGSSVVYGRAEGVVVATGMNTELGKIATNLASFKSQITPLQRKMDELSKVLSLIVVSISVIMFVIGIIEGNDILEVFMLAVSLAVAAIPEGLSAVITITLAIGVQKMAAKKAIVRKLSSVEALGATEVICSDKTGTLTQNKMSVRKIYLENKLIDVSNIKDRRILKSKYQVANNTFDMLTNVMLLCNDTKTVTDKFSSKYIGDPTEIALVEFAKRIDIKKEEFDNKYIRENEIPFDSKRKLMTTVNKFDNAYLMCTKGAPESILSKCNKIYVNGSVRTITKLDRDNILKNNINMAKDALRVLAFAIKVVKDKNNIKEDDLVFVGLVAMIDPPRKEAKSAVRACYSASMIPVMITGDNMDTAFAIAKEIGITDKFEECITGVELDKLSDKEFLQKVDKIKVYARVSPENKIRIVKAWKSLGKTVAMTGDGVNDAPALKGADIGIGMGITGTEVSKSVSSMILADDNFATIVVAIKEGRRIYNNIQNVIVYLLASNLAEVILIFFSTLLNITMLVPIQLLWINLVTDTIPAIALGFEKPDRYIMYEKPRSAKEKFFTPFLTARIVLPAIIKCIIVFIMYYVVNNSYGSQMASASVFLLLSIIEILFSFVCRSDRKSCFEIGLFSNVPMIMCIIVTLLLEVLIVKNSTLALWLKIPQMPAHIYTLIIMVSIDAWMIFEFIKIILSKLFIKPNLKHRV